MNELLYLVHVNGQTFLFNKEKFLDFMNKNAKEEWSFAIGFLNSYEGFIPSMDLTISQFENYFNPEEIKPLLEYRYFKFGNTIVADQKFFNRRIYSKYGVRKKIIRSKNEIY